MPRLYADDAFQVWSDEVNKQCRRILGLTLKDLPELHAKEAFEAGLAPDSFFEELVLGSLSRGRIRAYWRVLGRGDVAPHPTLTVDELAAETAVRDVVPSPTQPETSMPTWLNFAEIRSRVSLEDVIFKLYGIDNLKRDGRKLVGPCPVHGGDSSRAFHADLDKNIWHCFSQCQQGGNQLDFVAKKDKLNVRDAALKLHAFFLAGGAPQSTPPMAPAVPSVPVAAPAAAAPVPPASIQIAATSQVPAARTPATMDDEGTNAPLTFTLALQGDHPHLVEERKLKPETIAAFGVGYCGKGTLRGMIAIPVHDEDGDLVAYAGRRLKPSEVRELGKYCQRA